MNRIRDKPTTKHECVRADPHVCPTLKTTVLTIKTIRNQNEEGNH
jgi:hypothetical protein